MSTSNSLVDDQVISIASSQLKPQSLIRMALGLMKPYKKWLMLVLLAMLI